MAPGDDFPIDNTRGLHAVGFGTVSGELFPVRLQIEMTDHDGELLRSTIAPRLDESLSIGERALGRLVDLLGAERVRSLAGPSEEFLFTYQLRTADAVVLTVDGRGLVENEDTYLSELVTVASRVRGNGGRIAVMVTKCDLLLDEYTHGHRIDPYGDGVFYADEVDGDLDSFQEFVTGLVRQRGQGEALLDAAGVELVFPVYYRTRWREDGTLVPRIEDGRPVGIGFERVAEWLERYLR
jgi:hypothetical protein